MATLILDTDVDESWIPAIGDFEQRLDLLHARSRVKAARDLDEVAEGLRIVVRTQCNQKLLCEPESTSMRLPDSHKTSSLLFYVASAYSQQRNDKYASRPNIHISKV